MADPTALTPYQMLAPFAAVGALAAHFTPVAGTITDGNTWVCNGNDLLFFQNSDAGAVTVTITSVVDEKNRLGTITDYSIGIGEFAMFSVGLTNNLGWQDTSKKIKITVSDADLKVAVIRLPDGYPN